MKLSEILKTGDFSSLLGQKLPSLGNLKASDLIAAGDEFDQMLGAMRASCRGKMPAPSLAQYEEVLMSADPKEFVNQARLHFSLFPNGEIDPKKFAERYKGKVDELRTLLGEARKSKTFNRPIPAVVTTMHRALDAIRDTLASSSPSIARLKEATRSFYHEANGLHEDFHSGSQRVASEVPVHDRLHFLLQDLEIFLRERPMREFLAQMQQADPALVTKIKDVSAKQSLVD